MESKTFTTSRAAITMTGEDVRISIDGKEVLYWHGDEWIEDHNVVFAILNAVLMAVQNPDALMKKCHPSYIPTETSTGYYFIVPYDKKDENMIDDSEKDKLWYYALEDDEGYVYVTTKESIHDHATQRSTLEAFLIALNGDLEKAIKDFLIVSDECPLMDTTGDKAFEYREKQAALRDKFKQFVGNCNVLRQIRANRN